MSREPESRESYLVYGPPGSGKSTACKVVAPEVGIDYVSVGDITRQRVAAGDDLGKRLKYYLDIPREYPTELIGEVMQSHVSGVVEGGSRFLMDGYPKYENEARDFRRFLEENPMISIGVVFLFQVPEEVAVARVAYRYICSNCQVQQEVGPESLKLECKHCSGKLVKREDDTEGFVRQRYSDYTDAITDTLNEMHGAYRSLVDVDALAPQEEVVAVLKRNIRISR